jgi:hypothetical protein
VTSQAEVSKKQPEGRDSYDVSEAAEPKQQEGESREQLQERATPSLEVAPEASPGAAPDAGGAESGQGSKREVEEAESPPPAKKARPCPARQVSDLSTF